MKTKLLLLKSLLVVALLGVGVNAWADDVYSDVYTKTLTGETAWATSDLTAWGVSDNNYFSVNETNGLKLTVNGYSYNASYTESSIATTSKIKYVVEWYVGYLVANNSNNITNNTFLMFGDKLRLSFDRGYNVYWSTDGTFIRDATHKVSDNSARDKTVTVTLIYDPIKRTIESFTTSGINSYTNDLTSVVNNALIKEDIDFRKVTFGYYRTGNNNDITTSIKSITISECTQDVPTGHRYTINAVDGSGNIIKSLKSDYAENGATVSVSNLNLVLYKGGKYYELDDAGVTSYAKSFTMVDEEVTFNVTYKEAADILYFSEGESIPNNAGSTPQVGASGGAYISYFPASKTTGVVTLNKGVYRAETYIWGRTNQHINLYNTSKGDANILVQLTGSNAQSRVFLIDTDNTSTVLSCTSNSCCFDYLLIRKMYDVTDASKIVGAVDYSTAQDGATSSDYTLKPGDTKVLTFKNHGSAVGATSSTWGYNWRILVKEGETYKAKVRADSYDETASAATKTAYRESKDGGTSTVALDWNDFAADMADATVVATFAYGVDGTLAITTTSTGTANGYIYYVDQDVTGLTGNVTVNLSVEKAWLEVLDVEQTTVGGTIGATGYATFSSTYALDFTDVEDLEAYTATVYNGSYVTMSKVTGTVAANTGLVLVGSTASIPVVASGDTQSGNLLVPCSSETTITPSATGTNYVLSVQGGNVVFAPVTGDNATVTAGHAFLYVPTPGARTLSIVFADEETTSISDASRLMDNGEMRNDNFFNLNGQRVEKPAKGLYIVNGKKVVVK